MTRVPIPAGVRSPFEVYLNGVRQELGGDYEIRDGALVFRRALRHRRIGVGGWLLGFWGIGTYGQDDIVDVRYERDGRPALAHALEFEPPA